MILTISDSEEGILNKIKSVLACESTLEVMEITNSEVDIPRFGNRPASAERNQRW